MIVQTGKRVSIKGSINKTLDKRVERFLSNLNLVNIFTYNDDPDAIAFKLINEELCLVSEDGLINSPKNKISIVARFDNTVKQTDVEITVRVNPKLTETFTYYTLCVELSQISLRDFLE